MKRLFFLTILTALTILPALAQDEPATRPARGQRGEGRLTSRPFDVASRPGPRPPRVELTALIDSLDLTAEQRAKVEQILASQRQEAAKFVRENHEKTRAVEAAIRQAREKQDAAALKASHDELVKLIEARGRPQEQLMSQLADVLTAEQMQRVRDAFDRMSQQPATRALAGLAGLDLDDDQKQQARAILDEANEQARATADPAEKDRIFKAAMEKILADVLTADQREQVQGNRNRLEAFGMLRGLHLTPEQHKQIQAIHQAMVKKLESADTPQARREIVESAMADVTANILTEEQRDQLENFRRRETRAPRPAPDSPPNPLDKLNLTDEQKKQIETIRQDSAATIEKAQTPPDRRDAMRTAMKQIRDVLTEEQRKQLDEQRPMSRPVRR